MEGKYTEQTNEEPDRERERDTGACNCDNSLRVRELTKFIIRITKSPNLNKYPVEKKGGRGKKTDDDGGEEKNVSVKDLKRNPAN